MKIRIKTLFAALMLLGISCTKESMHVPPATSTQTKENSTLQTTGHYIGEHFGGGVIFWMTKDKTHGLIADTVDLPGTGPWSLTFTITNVTDTAIGKGASNTRRLISVLGRGTYAANGCARHKGSGYTDWFLPSKNELNELYKQKDLVGGFTTSFYWTSSEYFLTNIWLQFFSIGLQSYGGPNNEGYVRPIRAF